MMTSVRVSSAVGWLWALAAVTTLLAGACLAQPQSTPQVPPKLPEGVSEITKEHLLREVWDFRSLGRTRTLDSHASRLRRKLGAAGPGNFVINVWGVGYKLVEE